MFIMHVFFFYFISNGLTPTISTITIVIPCPYDVRDYWFKVHLRWERNGKLNIVLYLLLLRELLYVISFYCESEECESRDNFKILDLSD